MEPLFFPERVVGIAPATDNSGKLQHTGRLLWGMLKKIHGKNPAGDHHAFVSIVVSSLTSQDGSEPTPYSRQATTPLLESIP